MSMQRCRSVEAISSRLLSRSIALALGLASIGMTSGALAQSDSPAPAEVTEIVVTGSRIRGVEAVGSNVIAVDQEQIIETGTATTSDLIRKLPQIVGLGASETAASAQNGAANVTRGVSVNLRGIGSNATLLLFGGRRMPPAGTQGQYTDASVIPSIALERLEVVPDGGSAIYGSDAVTGVVNMIPRRDFTGAETAARYGSADGYDEWSVGQLFGFGWSSGHMMAALEYLEHDHLNGADRDFYTSNLVPGGGSDFRAQQCSPGTILVGTTPYAIPQSSTGTGLTPGSFTPNTRNVCDNIKRGDIIPSLERASAVISATQDLTESLSLFAEGFYSRREFGLQAAQIVSNLTVTNVNPFYVNPTGGTGPITVQYDFDNDGGLPNDPGRAQSWEGVLGARLNLGANWRAEAYAAYGESEDFVNRNHNLNTTANGINAALADPNPATAFNPFGQGGISNPATVAAIRNGLFVIASETSLTVAGLQADGPLFSLPGGEVRLAAGAEYRDEGLSGSLTSGSSVTPTVVPNDYSRDVYGVFAEVFVPIVGADNAIAGIQKLDVSLAGRYEEYSDFGDTLNPKVGVNWQIVDAVGLHGSWGTSFRAPGLAEIDLRSSGYGLYGDTLPCNHRPPAVQCFGIGIAGGNEDLEPEEATTWSIGVTVTPAALPGFRANVTYFNIDYDNQIVGLRGTAGLLTNPVYTPYRILDPTPAQVNALLASGLPINTPINASLVTYIQDGRRQNVGGTLAEGYDFDVRNTWDTSGAGDFTLGLAGSYFTKLTTAIAPGAPQQDVLGTINYPQEYRLRGEAGWRRGQVNATAFVNYVDSYEQTGVTPVRKIDSFTTVDLHVGYDFQSNNAIFEDLSLALDVQNLADEEPPFVNLSGGYDPQSASPMGRLVALSLRKSW
jgi:iron complex outermembrane receptor protein